MGVVDQAGVVDPGRRRRIGWGLGSSLDVGVPPDPVRDRRPGPDTADSDRDRGQVERVEHQLDPAPDEARVDLIGVALQRHQRGLGHGALCFPEERLRERGRGGQRERAAGVPARQRRGPGLGVLAAVIDGLDPGGEQPVQLVQVGEGVPARVALGVAGDLDEELVANGPEEAFDLAAALRATRGGVDQPDPELRAGSQQPGVDERRAVVDIDRVRDSPGAERRAQRGGEADGVLGEPEPVPHDRPGVVIEEGEQVGLAPADVRAVQGVAGPHLVGAVGLEPTEHRLAAGAAGGERAQLRADQRIGREVALQGPLPGRPAHLGAQDPPHLRGRAGRVLPLERDRHLDHLDRQPRAGLARIRDQGVEPAPAPCPDPPVQGVAGDPPLSPGWVEVFAGGDLAHQPAAGLGRQPRVGRLADQLVAEQPDRPGLLRPRRHLVISHRHEVSHLLVLVVARRVRTSRDDHRGRSPDVRGNSCCSPPDQPGQARPARAAALPRPPRRPARPAPRRRTGP